MADDMNPLSGPSGDGQPEIKASRVSRRQLIKGGMIAGGVALWSAPVVAAARFGRFDRVRTISPVGSSVKAPGPTRSPVVTNQEASVQNHTPCTGYPAETCLTFECGGSVTECGDGVVFFGKTFRCFCDTDIDGNCFCGNDAPCSLLPGCSANSDCPPGWACIPSSCCAGTKCVPPCGSFPSLGLAGITTNTAQAQRAGIDPSRLAEIEKILAGGRMSGLR